jgi:flagellar hook-associated protein 3 FlgL
MERISTFGAQQSAMLELLRAQRAQFEAQNEVSTGKRIQSFADKPAEVGGLLALKSAAMKNEDFMAGAEAVQLRLRLQDNSLNGIAGIAGELRQKLFDAIANNSGVNLMHELNTAYQSIRGMLNQSVDGKHLFAGTRSDVEPVGPATLADLAALPAVADAFENSDVRPSARVDEGLSVQFGQLASDIAAELFGIMRAIAQFNAGVNGPINGKLTDAQSVFLQAQLQPLATSASNLNLRMAENGQAQIAVENAIGRQSMARDMYKELVSKSEDADLMAAVQKLNASQTALQASVQTYSSVQRLSLLDFL